MLEIFYTKQPVHSDAFIAKILRTYYNPCFHTQVREVNARDAFTGEALDEGRLVIPPLSACVVAF